jgi:hypothetical protein
MFGIVVVGPTSILVSFSKSELEKRNEVLLRQKTQYTITACLSQSLYIAQ